MENVEFASSILIQIYKICIQKGFIDLTLEDLLSLKFKLKLMTYFFSTAIQK